MKNGCPIKPGLSGAEPEYNPDAYNKDPAKKHSHNCYSFGFQIHDEAKIKECREQNKCNFHVPGKAVGHPEFRGRMGKTCGDVIGRTLGDNKGAYMTDFQTACKPGFTKVGIIVDDKRDFHYVPQFKEIYVPELKRKVPGLFAHKPGATDATDRDGAGSIIFNPELANWYYPKKSQNDDGLYYNHSCGFVCRPTQEQAQLKGGRTRRLRKH